MFLAVLLVSFSGMARISEALVLCRKHIVTHLDLLQDDPQIFFNIVNPKTKRLALRQHFKVDDAVIVKYLIWAISNLRNDDPLYDGSPAMFRLRWDRLCQALGLPFGQKDEGITPGCMRGSGATFHYRRCEDIPRLAWRGRWFRVQTLEHYLQEVSGQVLLTRLSEAQRQKLRELSNLALASILDVCQRPSP